MSTLGKLVFIGLFSNADDEGRGRANPTYLKSILFPYEESIRSADIDKTLSEISSNMSVVFYTCNGSSYYSLTKWYDWQKIEKPQDSKLPAYDENNKEIQLLFHDQSATNRRPVDNQSSLIEENKKRIRIRNKKKRREYISRIYRKYCVKLPQVQKITEKRKNAIDAFLKEFNLKQFRTICKNANMSEFLTGKNNRKWKADFDFLMRTDKATSILEGKYNNKSQGKLDDFIEMYKQEVQNEQSGNNTSNNNIGW